MKRLILLLGAVAMCTTTALAQRIKVGPEIGVNWSKFNVDARGIDEDDFKMRPGLKVGGIVDIGFNRMFSFQPGVFFNQKGSRDKYSEGVAMGRRYIDDKYRINYLELPMNFQLKFGHPYRGQFFIGAGPYLAFAIGGERDWKETVRTNDGTVVFRDDGDEELEFGNDDFDDNFRGSDAGLNLNLGFMGPRGFFVRGNAGIGLANIMPERNDDFSYKNLSLSLTLGMLFGN
ncbi:MAG TPA: porin family protein [Flavipsychrobacter sp.]|nr:porin family protein [Flavipsychrobacter sp.]